MDEKKEKGELTPQELEHLSRVEMLRQEQPEVDDIEVTNNPNSPKSILNPEIMAQYDQAREPSAEQLKLREYKARQMEEFTNDYSISRVVPSGWATFFNVLSTILLTLVLVIAFFIAFGLLFGLRIGIVPTDSMEPEIPTWSLVIIRPVDSPNDIRVGDTLSYIYDGVNYIHKVVDITPGDADSEAIYIMEGANPTYEGQSHPVIFSRILGKMVLSVPGLGAVIYFIQNNIILTVSVVLTIIIALILIRVLLERKRAKAEIKDYIEKKAEYEEAAERRYKEQKRKQDEKEFAEIMRGVKTDGNVLEMENIVPIEQNSSQNTQYTETNNGQKQ